MQYGQNGSLQLKNYQGQFQPVALQPGETVTVIMTLTAPDFGQPADVQVLDGGAINALPSIPRVGDLIPQPPTPPLNLSTGASVIAVAMPTVPPYITPSPMPTPPPAPDPTSLVDTGQTVPVSVTGQLVFSFRPGDGPGMHRVSIVVGPNQYILQFWQQDLAKPNNNLSFLHAY